MNPKKESTVTSGNVGNEDQGRDKRPVMDEVTSDTGRAAWRCGRAGTGWQWGEDEAWVWSQGPLTLQCSPLAAGDGEQPPQHQSPLDSLHHSLGHPQQLRQAREIWTSLGMLQDITHQLPENPSHTSQRL